MPLLLLTLLLCSCSPRQHEGHDIHRFSQKSDMNQTDVQTLSRYSDMSAAFEAGRTPASSQARPESAGGK